MALTITGQQFLDQPGSEWLLGRHETLDRITDRARRASDARQEIRTDLIAQIKEAEGNLILRDNEAAKYGVAIDLDGNPDRQVFVKKIDRLKARLELETGHRPPAGRAPWREKLREVEELISSIAERGTSIAPYVCDDVADAKRMEAAGAKARKLTAESDKVDGSYPPLAESEALLRSRGHVDAPPFSVHMADPVLSRRSKLPSLRLQWHDGALAPSAKDLESTLRWLAGDRVYQEEQRQLVAEYARLEARGATFLSDADRRKAMVRLGAQIHAAELEEAHHLVGLVEAGANVFPPKRISARALLAIA